MFDLPHHKHGPTLHEHGDILFSFSFISMAGKQGDILNGTVVLVKANNATCHLLIR
jgi:hypothetical protein